MVNNINEHCIIETRNPSNNKAIWEITECVEPRCWVLVGQGLSPQGSLRRNFKGPWSDEFHDQSGGCSSELSAEDLL